MFGGRREGLTRAQMADVFVPALPLCLLFGVVVAAVTDTLFHDGVLAACRHPFGRGVNYFGWMLGCLISRFALSTPLVPVPLYEAGWLLAAFAAVRLWAPRGRRAAVSLMAMGAGRFALEFLRGDSRGVFFPGVPLSPAQCLSIVLLLLGASLLLRAFERPARVQSSGVGEKDGRGPAASGT